MNLNDIIQQCAEDSRTWFPDKEYDVPFQTLCLGGEVGEFQNLVKKVERGTHSYTELRDLMRGELTDAFIYMCVLASILEMDLEESYHATRAANVIRFSVGSRTTPTASRPLVHEQHSSTNGDGS